MIKPLIKRIAGIPTPQLYDRIRAYSLLRRMSTQFRSAQHLPRREAVWDMAVERLRPHKRVLYLEFGVYEGYSIRYFSERLQQPEARFIGFDSFEGLPERWGKYEQGTFTTRGAVPELADSRVRFVKGWFQDTLPYFLATDESMAPARAADCQVFVHFDADLYSSTLFLLATLYPHLTQYYFCFDEFMSDELRALHDFSEAYPSRMTFLAYDQIAGYPARMFGHIERVGGPVGTNSETQGALP